MAIKISTLNDMKTFAIQLANVLSVGDVVALTGTLGAGKTTFTQFCINELSQKDAGVTSPTFNILQLYDAKDCMIAHADLYRIESPLELDELGLEEYFQQSITFIEWPEKASDILPRKKTLFLTIKIEGDETREIELSGNTEVIEALHANTV